MAKLEEKQLDWLENTPLISNTKYIDLKHRLEEYYKQRELKPISLHKGQSPRVVDRLYGSLQVLLSEVIRTKDMAKQAGLLDKTHDWFFSKMKHGIRLPLIFTPEPAKKHSANTRVNITHRKHTSTPVPYMPEPMKCLKQKEKFQDIYSKYTIDLRTTEKRHKSLQEWSKSKSLQRDIREMGNIQIKPVHLHRSSHIEKDYSPHLYDLRYTQIHSPSQHYKTEDSPHHFVNSFYQKSDIMLENQIKEQFNEVHFVKNKLAAMNVPCPVDYLEIATLNTPALVPTMPLDLPRGGEKLIQAYKPPRPPVKKGKKKGKKRR